MELNLVINRARKSRKNVRRVTRSDVARAANVSLATVTYSLNPSDKLYIGDKARRRVQRIAQKLGYRPNFMHRALAAGKTYSVGLVIPDSKSLLFPFYDLIINGLLSSMNAANYDPVLLVRNRWDRVEQVIHDGRLDGLFILQSDLDDSFIIRTFDFELPVVVLNRNLPQGATRRIACVHSDHYAMTQQVVDEFVSLGCRKILNFSDTKSTFAHAMTFDAFSSIASRLAAKGVIIRTVPPVWEGNDPQAAGLFTAWEGWDAVFINSSLVTGSFLREAENHNLHAGRDFQLITTDAFLEEAPYGKPKSLRRERTFFIQQPYRVGEAGWAMMDVLLAKDDPSVKEHLIPYVRMQSPK